MFFKGLSLTLALGLATVLACPDHDYHSQQKTQGLRIHKRAEGAPVIGRTMPRTTGAGSARVSRYQPRQQAVPRRGYVF